MSMCKKENAALRFTMLMAQMAMRGMAIYWGMFFGLKEGTCLRATVKVQGLKRLLLNPVLIFWPNESRQTLEVFEAGLVPEFPLENRDDLM